LKKLSESEEFTEFAKKQLRLSRSIQFAAQLAENLLGEPKCSL